MFSVVIPIYNHAAFLGAAVRSALRSRLVDEVLLLDDGSTDGSVEIARRLAVTHADRVRDVTPRIGHNRGAAARLNELVELAKQSWIAVLNSDDLFVPGRFETVLESPGFQSSDFVFGNLVLINQRGALVGAKCGPFDFGLFHREGPDRKKLLDVLGIENYVLTTSNMIFRKALHNRLGGFAAFRYVHDWDFALRAIATERVLYVPSFLTAYRIHSRNTILESSAKVDLEIVTMLDRFSMSRTHP